MRLYRNRQGLTKGKNRSKEKPSSGQSAAASKKAKQAAATKKKAKANAKGNRGADKTPHKTRPELTGDSKGAVLAFSTLRIDCLSCGGCIALRAEVKLVRRTLPEMADRIARKVRPK